MPRCSGTVRHLGVALALTSSCGWGRTLRVAPAAGAPTASKRKLKLEIHYETQCKFSLDLVTGKGGLRDVWQDPELRSHIDLHLYPAGNSQAVRTANLSKGYRYWHPSVAAVGAGEHVILCQHGESECLGNMIQACAIEKLKEPSKYLPLIFCMSALPQFAVEKSSFECATELKMDLEPLRECADKPEGNALMFSIVSKSNSLSPPRGHVPWVVIDGEHSTQADHGNLLGALCGALGNEPKACAGLAQDVNATLGTGVAQLLHAASSESAPPAGVPGGGAAEGGAPFASCPAVAAQADL